MPEERKMNILLCNRVASAYAALAPFPKRNVASHPIAKARGFTGRFDKTSEYEENNRFVGRDRGGMLVAHVLL
jgi:hypothetical protein